MADRNSPRGRAPNNSGNDSLQAWIDARLAELRHVSGQYRSAAHAARRAALVRAFDSDAQGDFDGAGEELTCCFRGRTTREIPCQNPNYIGCPFRNDLDRDRGRERTPGYGR
jgi:hypothetical protein